MGLEKRNLLYIKKYLEWADKMIIEYPETSKVLRNIAETYKKESIAIRDEANYAQTWLYPISILTDLFYIS